MSEFKHTPGPWEVREIELHEGGTGIEVVGANGDVICDNQSYYPCAVSERNVNLIAAAPELLEALLAIVGDKGVQRVNSDLLNQALTAIAKATGE